MSLINIHGKAHLSALAADLTEVNGSCLAIDCVHSTFGTGALVMMMMKLMMLMMMMMLMMIVMTTKTTTTMMMTTTIMTNERGMNAIGALDSVDFLPTDKKKQDKNKKNKRREQKHRRNQTNSRFMNILITASPPRQPIGSWDR